MSIRRNAAVIFTMALVAGCAHYYKVTDPSTGKVYYTEEVSHQGAAVHFKDAKTGAETTLQNSQVLEIEADAFKAATAPAATPPAATK